MNEAISVDNDEVRISIQLSPTVRRAVEEIMRLGDYATFEDAVRRAISDELFLQKQRSSGATIMVKNGKEYQELVWSE